MNEWFTASDLAGTSGLPTTDRRIREAAKRQGWKSRKRSKGKGLEYHIGSLPAEAQAALAIAQGTRSGDYPATTGDHPHAGRVSSARKRASASFNYDPDALWARYDALPERMKHRAQQRLAALQAAQQLIDRGAPKRAAWQTVAGQLGVGRSSIQRWATRAGRYHTADWLPALADGYTGRTATAELDDRAWDYIRADYLRPEAPTAAACYERLQEIGRENGWQLPCKRTIERRLAEIPRAISVLARQGESELMAMYPPMKRSVCDLHACQWINGDGYQHNVFVQWPDGTIGRPKTWFWQDVHSRKMLAWRTDQSENADVIRQAFGDVITRYGIPSHVTIDNTRAAANKWMTGGVPNRYRFRVLPDDPLGLIPSICGPDSVHWTSVYNGRGHGQAKPVERAFGVGGVGEYIDKHPSLAGAYTGPNPTAKPENYASRAIPLADFLATLNSQVRAINARAGRRTEMAGGVKSYDQVFAESYERAAIRKATAEQRRMLMLTAEARKVDAQGMITLDAGSAAGVGKNRYACDALHQYIGRKVIARFDPQQLHEAVHIYTLDNRYIGQADCQITAGFGDSEAGRRHARARKAWMRAQKEMAGAERRMTTEEAARLLPDTPEPDDAQANVVRPIFARAVGSDLEPEPGDDAEYDAKFSRFIRAQPTDDWA